MDLTIPALPALSAALRVLHFLALFAAAGGGLFLVLATRDAPDLARRVQPGLLLMSAIAGAAAILDLGTYGAIVIDGGFRALVWIKSWWTAFTDDRGLGTSLLLLGLAPLALGIAGYGRGAWAPLTFTGAVIAAASPAVDTAAAYADPRWLSAAAVVLHGLGTALWLGGLWPLVVTLTTQEPAVAARLMRRFMRIALCAWILLGISGLLLSPVALADPAALVGTGYGRAWLLKLGIAAGLLALAAARTRALLPALEDAVPGAAEALRKAVFTQAALGFSLVLVSLALEIAPVSSP
jgi:putative copper export protein